MAVGIGLSLSHYYPPQPGAARRKRPFCNPAGQTEATDMTEPQENAPRQNKTTDAAYCASGYRTPQAPHEVFARAGPEKHETMILSEKSATSRDHAFGTASGMAAQMVAAKFSKFPDNSLINRESARTENEARRTQIPLLRRLEVKHQSTRLRSSRRDALRLSRPTRLRDRNGSPAIRQQIPEALHDRAWTRQISSICCFVSARAARRTRPGPTSSSTPRAATRPRR
jgi:hypothetical protein